MMKDLINRFVDLNKNESYIAGKSINELGGPYHSRFSAHLLEMHEDDYDRIWKEIHNNDKIRICDIPLVLETLYLLIHEMSDGDFLALYDGVTKEDVTVLYEKLQKIYDEYLSTKAK